MGFWQKVDDELTYLGKSRKELAAEAHFDVSYISKGIERNGIPIADTALRIARALHVSLDYLLDMEMPTETTAATAPSAALDAHEVRSYRKYKPLLDQLERLPAKGRRLVTELAAALADMLTEER